MKSSVAALILATPRLLAAESNELPLVTVTGNKLGSKAEQQAGGYSLIDQQRLASLPLTAGTYQDLFALVAGGYGGNPSVGPFSLRGLNQDNVFGYVGTGSNSLIAVLENGAPLSSNTLRFLPPVLWNLDQAEILRGPQSLSHGPNSLGGALILQSGEPSFTWQGKALNEFSEDGGYRGGIQQNLVLLPAQLAVDLSYYHQESDGQATNLFTGDDEFAATERDRFEARLLWHPAGNREVGFDLSLVHDRSRGNPFGTVNEAGGRDLFDRKNSLNTPSDYPADRSAATFNATFALPGELELKSTTSLQRLDLQQSFDLDATPLLAWFVNGSNDELRFTEDVLVARKSGPLQWLAGFYYEHSDYKVGFAGRGLAPFPSGSRFDNEASEKVEIAALYGRFDWEFVEHFHLTSGVRLNHEKRGLQSEAVFGPFPQVTSGNDHSNTDLLPQLGIAWQPDETTAVGLQVSRGYRGGGVGYAPTLGVSQPYDPEYAWEAELYSRLAPTAATRVSATIFHSWMEDQQVPVNAPGGFPSIDTLIVNAGSSRRYGAEVEASWQAADALTIHAAAGLTKTEFTRLVLNGVDRSGQSFPNAPEWTASVGADYRHASGFFGSVLFSWADTAYTFATSPDVTALEARQLLSARIGYSWEHASLYVFGSNLLDDEYALLRADNSSQGQPVSGKPGAPRILGIGCEVRW